RCLCASARLNGGRRLIAGILDVVLERFGLPFRVFGFTFRTQRGEGPSLGFPPRGVNIPSRAGGFTGHVLWRWCSVS
ncbi:hypothetical protein A2U01_0082993, partial [Trifolium medium]|nr:hypothetical protein [Trifolium medium]